MFMSSGLPSQARATRLQTQQEKQARVYEEEVYPLHGQKLADLVVANLTSPSDAQVLQIGCGLGTTTMEILEKVGPEARLTVAESSPLLVERARANVAADHLDRLVSFRALDLDSKLPFAENAFDLVLANVGVADLASPSGLLFELARVAKPGGEVRLVTPLAGTWREFLDVFSDVLVRLRREESATALSVYAKEFPEPEALARQMERAGLGGISVETTRWKLVFRTGREFFYAPVIELGPLPRWKAVAGKGPEMQDIFVAVKEAIDTYYGASGFGVSVVAGLFSGRKPA
jgi:ubiquinone/menaquinone biosynthesis C-methylase UbiE